MSVCIFGSPLQSHRKQFFVKTKLLVVRNSNSVYSIDQWLRLLLSVSGNLHAKEINNRCCCCCWAAATRCSRRGVLRLSTNDYTPTDNRLQTAAKRYEGRSVRCWIMHLKSMKTLQRLSETIW